MLTYIILMCLGSPCEEERDIPIVEMGELRVREKSVEWS